MLLVNFNKNIFRKVIFKVAFIGNRMSGKLLLVALAGELDAKNKYIWSQQENDGRAETIIFRKKNTNWTKTVQFSGRWVFSRELLPEKRM